MYVCMGRRADQAFAFMIIRIKVNTNDLAQMIRPIFTCAVRLYPFIKPSKEVFKRAVSDGGS